MKDPISTSLEEYFKNEQSKKKKPSKKKPASTVIATPYVNGEAWKNFAVTMVDYENQPPKEEIIGEAVKLAVEKAWESGIDPASKDFQVVITFE